MPVSRHPLSGSLPAWAGVPIDASVAPRLEASIEVLKPVGEALARDFYNRLFARYPGVRSMFPTDMREQEKKIFASLVTVVEHLRSPGSVRESLLQMGARHAGYGAKAEHYPLVCATLLESMAAALGSKWTLELSSEWSQALHLVSLIMIEGAGQSTRPPGPNTAAPTSPDHPTM